MPKKYALGSAAVLALGALALTACQPDATARSAPPNSPSATAHTSAPGAATSTAPAEGATHPSTPSTHAAPRTKAPAAKNGSSGSSGSGGDATSDEYAYKHPCSPQQLTVRVARRPAAPSQRVITVRNNGRRSCGLSYYPLVYLDHANSPDGTNAVHPLIPSGLGGPPAYPLHAATTAYAVIDLDPSGATTGTVPGIDELNVLADGDHMPNAATLNFPLSPAPDVLKPKLGLYRDNIPDAVTSMESADYQS